MRESWRKLVNFVFPGRDGGNNQHINTGAAPTGGKTLRIIVPPRPSGLPTAYRGENLTVSEAQERGADESGSRRTQANASENNHDSIPPPINLEKPLPPEPSKWTDCTDSPPLEAPPRLIPGGVPTSIANHWLASMGNQSQHNDHLGVPIPSADLAFEQAFVPQSRPRIPLLGHSGKTSGHLHRYGFVDRSQIVVDAYQATEVV